MNADDDMYSNCEKVLSALEIVSSTIINPIVKFNVKKRNTTVRAPKRLPSQSTMVKLRNYIISEIEKISSIEHESICSSDFIKLRKLVISRLIAFNSRRVNEPCQATIAELEEAFSEKWVDHKQLHRRCNSKQLSLIRPFYITYINCKNASKSVDLLIPKSLKSSIDIMLNADIRAQVGVHTENGRNKNISTDSNARLIR